ncbi:MAG: alpha/beta fold hydrolase [Clostridia bacterium]
MSAFFREVGQGPGVVCLHANASTSGQWRSLMEALSGRFRVFAVDSYGSGKSPEWPSDDTIRLADEAELIEPVLERAGEPLTLVGHSYGGAVALIAALKKPERVRALVLYEPTLFALIDQASPPPNDADGIRNCVADCMRFLDAGNRDAAAERFIDYWMVPGAWAAMPAERKPAIAASVTKVRRWAHALTREPAPLEAFRRLDMPVLYMTGRRSTASALGVAKRLCPVLPRVQVMEFEKLGHMGPVTHPEQVSAAIRQFLEGIA